MHCPKCGSLQLKVVSSLSPNKFTHHSYKNIKNKEYKRTVPKPPSKILSTNYHYRIKECISCKYRFRTFEIPEDLIRTSIIKLMEKTIRG